MSNVAEWWQSFNWRVQSLLDRSYLRLESCIPEGKDPEQTILVWTEGQKLHVAVIRQKTYPKELVKCWFEKWTEVLSEEIPSGFDPTNGKEQTLGSPEPACRVHHQEMLYLSRFPWSTNQDESGPQALATVGEEGDHWDELWDLKAASQKFDLHSLQEQPSHGVPTTLPQRTSSQQSAKSGSKYAEEIGRTWQETVQNVVNTLMPDPKFAVIQAPPHLYNYLQHTDRTCHRSFLLPESLPSTL
ncbi:hypothetical protein M231_05302 [Tremella mesenterica]|uniref:Uncharacterized protein n=2 Tax=Tremella mesenterica TaxID=5217 RepID=A0A4Q1BIE4_TREME|nr:hypothetical protein M231_05302 [Tremella mesenterica]